MYDYRDIRIADGIMKKMLKDEGKCDLTIEEIIKYYKQKKTDNYKTWGIPTT